jgi:hypothetical protein
MPVTVLSITIAALVGALLIKDWRHQTVQTVLLDRALEAAGIRGVQQVSERSSKNPVPASKKPETKVQFRVMP